MLRTSYGRSLSGMTSRLHAGRAGRLSAEEAPMFIFVDQRQKLVPVIDFRPEGVFVPRLSKSFTSVRFVHRWAFQRAVGDIVP